MDPALATALIGTLCTGLGTLLGILLTKGRLGDVIAGDTDRENTAVQAMIGIADKALDGWITMSTQVAALSQTVMDHRAESRGRMDRYAGIIGDISTTMNRIDENSQEILSCQQELKETLNGIGSPDE